jgi:hypothetical protein
MKPPDAVPTNEAPPAEVSAVGYSDLMPSVMPRCTTVVDNWSGIWRLAGGRLRMLHAETIKAEAAERMALIHTRCGLRLCP